MRVKLREIQFTDTKGQLHKESEIQRVIEIKKPAEQLDLNWEPGGANDTPRLENQAGES